MIFQFSDLGVLDQAELELGKLTIICGNNNTGKTYATYAIFGFLNAWKELLRQLRLSVSVVENLVSNGEVSINVSEIVTKAPDFLDQITRQYTTTLPRVFGSAPEKFRTTSFKVAVEDSEIRPLQKFQRNIRSGQIGLLQVEKLKGEDQIKVSLLVEKEHLNINKSILRRQLSDIVYESVFGNLFPPPFIASAERTGAAIFQKELDLTRNRLVETLGRQDSKTDIDPFELIESSVSDYALPVKQNINFIRRLSSIVKNQSFIAEKHPEILADFSDIIGGEFGVARSGDVFFTPRKKKVKLAMDESSSGVRSLLDIGFYLKHSAQPGDLLMVDEPELNLHPENQRRVARLFARLVNVGIRVFVTTHSDYIIKELNTLIMLNQRTEDLTAVAEKFGYRSEELLSADKVRVYIAEKSAIKREGAVRNRNCHTLVPAEVSATRGIDARSFDSTISEMNKIQDEILYVQED